MHVRLLSSLCGLGCLFSSLSIPAYAQPTPLPEHVDLVQWQSLTAHWGRRARTALVTRTDGTTARGFLVGVYPEGLALVKDSPHPFVETENMEIVVLRPEEVTTVTVYRTNHLLNSPRSRSYLLGTQGLSWKQLQRRLRPYQQANSLAEAKRLPAHAPADASDPATWENLAPVMPRVARTFGPKPWYLTANTLSGLHTGFEMPYPEQQAWPTSPHVARRLKGIRYSFTGGYTTPNGWDFGLTYRQQTERRVGSISFISATEPRDEFWHTYHSLTLHELIATTGYNLLQPTTDLDRRSQLTLTAGAGFLWAKECNTYFYAIQEEEAHFERASNIRTQMRANVQVGLTYAYHLTPRWALQTSVLAQTAGSAQTLPLYHQGPLSSLDIASQTIHYTSVMWGFGVRYKL